MSFKINEIRNRFGFSKEELNNILGMDINEETDKKIEDIISTSDNELKLKIDLDQTKYTSKFSLYKEVLEEYFSSYDIYVLSRNKKMNLLEWVLDMLIVPEVGPISTAYELADLSPYYLLIKNDVKLLVNIKKLSLEVIELQKNISIKKFEYNGNKFRNSGKLKL